jgi:hypothetical protein
MSYFLESLPLTLTANKDKKTVLTLAGEFFADNIINEASIDDLKTRLNRVETDTTANISNIATLVKDVSDHENRVVILENDNISNILNISNLNNLTKDHEKRITNLETTAGKAAKTVLLDSSNPYRTAQDEYVYVTDTSCTFATVRIPENQDTHFGFSFRVVDYGSGGFQIVQSDNQQIVVAGVASTVGANGGLKSCSKFGAVSLILVRKGEVDVFVVDGELPSNMVLF